MPARPAHLPDLAARGDRPAAGPAVATVVPGVAGQLRALADQVDQLDVPGLLGALETLRFRLWMTALPPPPAAPPAAGAALAVAAVVQRTGMSKDWLYREARAGRLPFARRLGRRVVFDAAGLTRWLERRGVQRTP